MKPVRVHGLSKSYGNVKALGEISFGIEEGEIFGFIGPDGAGKSTLFRIITTLLKPDRGEVSVLGLDVVADYWKIRPKLGYMPGRFSLYQDLSVEENLEFFASVFGTRVEANYELIRPIFHQLEPFRDRLAGNLSGGMKQKLALSCALIHRPKLLVLDEPTTGVDAVSRKEFWEMLDRIQEQGITILVSTPYMDEAARCDRVALIQSGEVLKIAPPNRIVSELDRKIWAVTADDKYGLITELRGYAGSRSVHPFGETVHLTVEGDALDTADLQGYLQRKGIEDARIEPAQTSIEDVFMALMEGRGAGNDD